MSGCARSNGITADLLSRRQAKCKKVYPSPSRSMFTSKPGSCLISSASFFASPSLTAVNMITRRKRKTKLGRGRKVNEKEGEHESGGARGAEIAAAAAAGAGGVRTGEQEEFRIMTGVMAMRGLEHSHLFTACQELFGMPPSSRRFWSALLSQGCQWFHGQGTR